MEKKEILKLEKEFDEESQFILGNIELSGFYRVNYDNENWKRIIDQLKSNKDVRLSLILKIFFYT